MFEENYVYCHILQCSLGPSFWHSTRLSCWAFLKEKKKKANPPAFSDWRYFKSVQLAQPFFLSVSYITLKKHGFLLVFQFLLGRIFLLFVYSLLLHWKQKGENTILNTLLDFCTTWMEKVPLQSHPFHVPMLDTKTNIWRTKMWTYRRGKLADTSRGSCYQHVTFPLELREKQTLKKLF